MEKKHQLHLLRIARRAIKKRFVSTIVLPEPAQWSQYKRALFVSLYKKGQLRGRVGDINPKKSFYQAVQENAEQAAFHDPRFPPLKQEELNDIVIEISVLSKPTIIEFKEPLELIRKLKPGIDGVILERDNHLATFLPSAWKDYPDPYDFLSRLSWKAHLPLEGWKKAKISVYLVESFREDNISRENF
ncbi:AmmeMemoRadiSam system protein A [Candidatus Woesearchaeota archaeon]|nr:AmmeMemoRadiSam system protein A [Candidatus Woesearchaeota archaeon]